MNDLYKVDERGMAEVWMVGIPLQGGGVLLKFWASEKNALLHGENPYSFMLTIPPEMRAPRHKTTSASQPTRRT